MQGSTRIDELRQKFHENPRRYFAPLANEYRKAGDPEQAIAICRAHLAQQPGHMSGHVVYAQALYDAKRTDESRSVFEKALALDPDNAIVLRHLGDIAREKGETDEAKHWYSRALDADPQDTEVAAYIAELTEPLTEIPATEIAETRPQAAAPSAAEIISAPEEAPAAEEVEVPRAEPSREPEIAASEEEERAAPELEEIPWRKTPPHEESPFVTRTMAELYAKQGYRDAALDVYRQLALQHPDDKDIFDRIEELERAPAEEMQPEPHVGEVPPQEPQPEEAQRAETFAPAEPASAPAEPMVAGLPTEGEVTREAAAEPGPAGEPVAPPPPEFPEINPLITDAPVEAKPFTFAELGDETVYPPSSEDLNLPVEEIDRRTPVHFTEVELSSGDTWDTDAWGAGFSSDEEVDLEFESHDVKHEPPSTPAQAETMLDAAGTTDEAAAPEPVAPQEAERAEVIAGEPAPAAEEGETVAEETAAPAEFEQPATAEEVVISEPEISEPEISEPELAEPEPEMAAPVESDLHHLEAAVEPAWSEPAPIHAVPPAEPIELEPTASGISEEAHFVAYSPQLPEEKDLPHFAPKGPTVREFFATLGAYRPPTSWPGGITAHAAASRMAPQPEREPLADVAQEPDYPLATDAFANLFPGSEVSEEDTRAAFALSGALAATTPPAARTPAAPAPPVSAEPQVPASEQESEEDIRRFREWLDGLAES